MYQASESRVKGVENLVEVNCKKRLVIQKSAQGSVLTRRIQGMRNAKLKLLKLNQTNKVKAARKDQVSRPYLTNLIHQKKKKMACIMLTTFQKEQLKTGSREREQIHPIPA
jgi:hypothetical protein